MFIIDSENSNFDILQEKNLDISFSFPSRLLRPKTSPSTSIIRCRDSILAYIVIFVLELSVVDY
jgi:hypothetical protein